MEKEEKSKHTNAVGVATNFRMKERKVFYPNSWCASMFGKDKHTVTWPTNMVTAKNGCKEN